jgi:hypothetical protein
MDTDSERWWRVLDENGTLDFRYQHLNRDGDGSSGESVIEEIDAKG